MGFIRMLLLCGSLLGLCSVAALPQLTIDATGPNHQSTRRITGGHVGSIGRKLPLQIVLKVRVASPDPSKPSEVEFILDNVGKDKVKIPISPNLGDIEPSDAKATYNVMHLSLFITKGKNQQSRLSGGADLYGYSNTVVVLDPGQSIHVLARILVPFDSSEKGNDQSSTLVAHAILNDETVKPLGDGMILDTQEIGSATSHVYTATSLFNSDE